MKKRETKKAFWAVLNIFYYISILFLIHHQNVKMEELKNINKELKNINKELKTHYTEEYIPPCNRDLLSRDIVDKCYIEED